MTKVFFRFFETTGDLAPYLAYEKSKHHIHNDSARARLLFAFGHSEYGDG